MVHHDNFVWKLHTHYSIVMHPNLFTQMVIYTCTVYLIYLYNIVNYRTHFLYKLYIVLCTFPSYFLFYRPSMLSSRDRLLVTGLRYSALTYLKKALHVKPTEISLFF